jgi:hypothetical protein
MIPALGCISKLLYRLLTAEERILEGQYEDVVDPKSGVVEPNSEFPRVLGEAFMPGVLLSLYAGEGSAPPDTFAVPGAREPDYQKVVPSNVNFGPSTGGVELMQSADAAWGMRCGNVLCDSC